MSLTQYDHKAILKAVKKVIAKENKLYPYSDSAIKDVIEAKHGIDCGNSRQIWNLRTEHDIPNRATRLWLYKHNGYTQTTK